MTITIHEMINREVLTNANELIQELSSTEQYQDEILEFSSKPDYEQAANDYVGCLEEGEQLDEILEYLANYDVDYDVLEGNSDVLLECIEEYVGYDVFCDDFNVEPDYIDALQFFIVTDYLADKLEQHGELVTHDFLGLAIWGRTCCGQAIEADSVIQNIYNNLVK